MQILQDRNFNVTLANDFIKLWNTGPCSLIVTRRLTYRSGASCSKLTMSLVKILIEWYANMLKFFAEKIWVAFAVQKLLTFFSAKNIRILCIESARTVNEMTLNELVKLTTLWTTGPRKIKLTLTLSTLGKHFSRRHIEIFFLYIFARKQVLPPHAFRDNLHEMSKTVVR